MALYDRSYMRDPYNPPRCTTTLIIVLIVGFVIQSIFLVYGRFDIYHHLGLSLSGLKNGEYWQFLTFQFMHSAPWPWHVLMNCVGLYFFGRPVEETLGSKRFLGIYFASGFVGGLLYVLTAWLLPNHPDAPVVGASAGVCGLIAVYCTLNPMQELVAWIYFFPVHIRARYFLLFLGLYSLYGTICPFDNVAQAAHLGGVIMGIGYVRWGYEREDGSGFFDWIRRRTAPRRRELVKAVPAKGSYWRKDTPSQDATELPTGDFISREVDPILDKISAHGIQSLTDREKKILEAARAKMAKR